jgi:hypothetical protein
MLDSSFSSSKTLYSIKKLETKPEWLQWIRDINSWCLQNDHDVAAPVVVPSIPLGVQTAAATAAHATLFAAYTVEFNKWTRSQLKLSMESEIDIVNAHMDIARVLYMIPTAWV